MTDLPRPLLDPALLDEILRLDADFGKRKLTGSLHVEIHYRSGVPLKAKTGHEHEHALTGPAKPA